MDAFLIIWFLLIVIGWFLSIWAVWKILGMIGGYSKEMKVILVIAYVFFGLIALFFIALLGDKLRESG